VTSITRTWLTADGVVSQTFDPATGEIIAQVVEPETPTQRVPDESDWQFPNVQQECE
jgi:hypothetical protein